MALTGNPQPGLPPSLWGLNNDPNVRGYRGGRNGGGDGLEFLPK